MLIGLQFGCGKARLDYSVSLTFYLQNSTFWRDNERTRTAYPCSSHEFAAVHASLARYVQQFGLFMRSLASLATIAVHDVALYTSPLGVSLG